MHTHCHMYTCQMATKWLRSSAAVRNGSMETAQRLDGLSLPGHQQPNKKLHLSISYTVQMVGPLHARIRTTLHCAVGNSSQQPDCISYDLLPPELYLTFLVATADKRVQSSYINQSYAA